MDERRAWQSLHGPLAAAETNVLWNETPRISGARRPAPSLHVPALIELTVNVFALRCARERAAFRPVRDAAAGAKDLFSPNSKPQVLAGDNLMAPEGTLRVYLAMGVRAVAKIGRTTASCPIVLIARKWSHGPQ